MFLLYNPTLMRENNQEPALHQTALCPRLTYQANVTGREIENKTIKKIHTCKLIESPATP